MAKTQSSKLLQSLKEHVLKARLSKKSHKKKKSAHKKKSAAHKKKKSHKKRSHKI
jgi:hypothetical protein